MSEAKGFYAQKAQGLDGKPADLSQYAGKVALVVNTASECGYTPQYKSLQAVYEKYRDKGFVVLAFPSNDFGAQEPGTNAEIQEFCELKYHTTFPLFGKDKVKGTEKQSTFHYLTESAPVKGEIKWNFEKFLIGRDGDVARRYESKVGPMDDSLLSDIEKLL